MKIEICQTPNPLVRDGTSQGQRRLKQLHPRYARVDERLLADFMNYASQYAKELQYYDAQNTPKGDWKDFFDRDIASVISLVAAKNNDEYKKQYNQLKDYFEEVESVATLKSSGAFEKAFQLIFVLTSEFNQWILKAVAEDDFKQHLTRLISSQLSPTLSDVLGAYKHAKDYVWFNDGSSTTFVLDNPLEATFNEPLASLWNAELSGKLYNLQTWLGETDADNSVFEIPSSDSLARFKKAGEMLITWIGSFLQAQTQLVNDAPKYLFEVIHHWPKHTPHMALYIAFIRLFKFAQIHINSITGRHLDYYYQKVLGFKSLPSSDDRVFLLFELAKQTKQHLLEAGTLFKAGFDQDGNPVQYSLNREVALNKATIAELGDIKSVFIDRTTGEGLRVYSANVANSVDGKGKEFTDSEPKWKPFSQSQIENGVLRSEEQQTAALAEIGFSISSPLLDLRQGERSVQLAITLDAAPQGALTPDQISVRFSGEKDWVVASVTQFELNGPKINLVATLSSTQPAVSGFDSTVLINRSYTSLHPVMEILLVHDVDNNQPFAYQNLKDAIISNIDLTVTANGVTDLAVQSNLGILDINKPFLAFGPRPVLGSAFYIGCDEAFRKPVTQMTISGEWLDPPTDFSEYYRAYYFDGSTDLKILKMSIDGGSGGSKEKSIGIPGVDVTKGSSGTSRADESTIIVDEVPINETSLTATISTLNENNWDPFSTQALFTSPTSKLEFIFPESSDSEPYFEHNPELPVIKQYSQSTQQGFIKFELAGPTDVFGHKLFAKVYAQRVVQLINDPETTQLPNEPYSPAVNALSLNYTAKTSFSPTSALTDSHDKFFQIYPFGYVEVNEETSTAASLLPQFKTNIDGLNTSNHGELYIGLSNVTPPQMVTLFIKVAEGSADPELNKETVHWSVLVNNHWRTLESKQISYNTTNDFNASGIIAITIPDDVTTEANLIAKSRVWLRASVVKNPTAVCDLIQIATQVGEASFSDNSNDEQFLAASLQANSIGKLVKKASQVKKISQPYASVEGKATEADSSFRTRVSERLRHKDRAIGIWDYEKLVLQEFDFIYKAKCINHTTYLFERAENDFFTSEFAPGYVTLIVVPDIRNQNAVNPLEPRVSLDNLDKIKTFLTNRMTPFAAKKLRVINPLYESIQLEFTVSFFSEYDPAIYLETLNQDIMRFLSPWAFFDSTTKEITFGGKIHRSSLVNFVEERIYVDYVTDFKMHHIPPEDAQDEESEAFYDIEEAVPTSARSIFVSHAQHLIQSGDVC